MQKITKNPIILPRTMTLDVEDESPQESETSEGINNKHNQGKERGK